MINMDMIGRIRDRKVYLGGAGTGSSFGASIDDVHEDHELKLEIAKSGYSASDHTMFVTKQIPVLFFFSGLHSDYHKPSDTWDKIDAETAAELVDLVADLSGRIAAEDRPEFVRVEPERRPGMPVGGGGGYGAYFGSVPDFGQIDKGVKFADIRPGSPADKAGLKGGDILVQFDEKPINNLYDFTYALRASKIGQTVTVKYLRDGEERTAKVTLEQRK
jgi:C-terminal processing protease CtpA/Prc